VLRGYRGLGCEEITASFGLQGVVGVWDSAAVHSRQQADVDVKY
jgi:hypothetical protein